MVKGIKDILLDKFLQYFILIEFIDSTFLFKRSRA